MIELFKKDENLKLQQEWLIAKEKEDEAKKVRIAIEEELIKVLEINPEQSKSFTLELIRFQTGFTTKWDSKIIDKIDLTKYKEEDFPFRIKLEEDSKKMVVFQNKYPDFYKDIASLRTQTVKKVSFSAKTSTKEEE